MEGFLRKQGGKRHGYNKRYYIIEPALRVGYYFKSEADALMYKDTKRGNLTEDYVNKIRDSVIAGTMDLSTAVAVEPEDAKQPALVFIYTPTRLFRTQFESPVLSHNFFLALEPITKQKEIVHPECKTYALVKKLDIYRSDLGWRSEVVVVTPLGVFMFPNMESNLPDVFVPWSKDVAYEKKGETALFDRFVLRGEHLNVVCQHIELYLSHEIEKADILRIEAEERMRQEEELLQQSRSKSVPQPASSTSSSAVPSAATAGSAGVSASVSNSASTASSTAPPAAAVAKPQSQQQPQAEEAQPEQKPAVRLADLLVADDKNIAATANFARVLDKLEQGFVLRKYGKSGSPHDRHVWYDAQDKMILWSSTSGGDIREMPLASITAIREGRCTDVLKKKGAAEKDDRYFSFVASDRTLDLEAPSSSERDECVSMFRQLLEQHGPKNASAKSKKS